MVRKLNQILNGWANYFCLGVVEQVGFRSTRLRTAEDSLLTVPNSVIAATPIDNMGARSHHRFSTTIAVVAAAGPPGRVSLGEAVAIDRNIATMELTRNSRAVAANATRFSCKLSSHPARTTSVLM